MWTPTNWQDLELAIGLHREGETLEFKRELPAGQGVRDLAKDAAAMSIAGGVLVIGVEEVGGEAKEITPIVLDGAAERVQQVIDANVAPNLAVQISSLRKSAGDTAGVLVVSIPASWATPHEYENRFPARAGATTRYLNEREVEALYLRRWQMRQEAETQIGIEGYQFPPGVRLDIGAGAVGVMRLHVRPPRKVGLPQEPHIGPELRDAVEIAASAVDRLIRKEFHPKSLDLLRSWEPAGTAGWRAGSFLQGGPPLSVMVGAMYGYGAGFSSTVTIDLAEGLEPDTTRNARCAHEHHWAIETMTLLSIAGSFFSPLPEAALLRVDLELGGLLDAVSWQASQGMVFDSGASRVTENLYVTGGMFAARDLREDPRAATSALLDRFMVAILEEGSDVVRWIETGSY